MRISKRSQNARSNKGRQTLLRTSVKFSVWLFIIAWVIVLLVQTKPTGNTWKLRRPTEQAKDERTIALNKKIMALRKTFGVSAEQIYAEFLPTQEDIKYELEQNEDILSHQSLPTVSTPFIYKTKQDFGNMQKKQILVTGGAGFLASHLIDSLMLQGHHVYITWSDECETIMCDQEISNIVHWLYHPNFQ